MMEKEEEEVKVEKVQVESVMEKEEEEEAVEVYRSKACSWLEADMCGSVCVAAVAVMTRYVSVTYHVTSLSG